MGQRVGEERASEEVRNAVIPEHELSLLNFEPMIAGGGKMAVAGENAVEFEPVDNIVTCKDSNTRRFPAHFPPNPQKSAKFRLLSLLIR
jgi:hypothetical protein